MKKVSLINLVIRGSFQEFATVLENAKGEFQYCVNEEDYDHVPVIDHLLVRREQVLALQLMGQGAIFDRDVYNAFPTIILAVKYHCNSVLYEMIKRKTAQSKQDLLEFVNMCGPGFDSALVYAISYRNIDGFRLLLNSGAQVDEKALALAALTEQEEMLRLMLKQIAGSPKKVQLISYALQEVEKKIDLFNPSENLRRIATILTSAREY